MPIIFSSKIDKDIAISSISKIYKDANIHKTPEDVRIIVSKWKKTPKLKYSDLVERVREKYTTPPLSKETAAKPNHKLNHKLTQTCPLKETSER